MPHNMQSLDSGDMVEEITSSMNSQDSIDCVHEPLYGVSETDASDSKSGQLLASELAEIPSILNDSKTQMNSTILSPGLVMIEGKEFVRGPSYFSREPEIVDEFYTQKWRSSKKEAPVEAKPFKRTNMPHSPDVSGIILTPNILDSARLLHMGLSDSPHQIVSVNVSNQQLLYISEKDLSEFTSLVALDISENALHVHKLGAITGLKQLNASYNNITSMGLIRGMFEQLTTFDLSFNRIGHDDQIALAKLPSLIHLDLTGNKISSLSDYLKSTDDSKIEAVSTSPISAFTTNPFEYSFPVVPSEILSPTLDEPIQPAKNVVAFEGTNSFNHSIPLMIQTSLPKRAGFPVLKFLSLEKNLLGKARDSKFISLLAHLPW